MNNFVMRFMDALATLCEHPMFGLLVWVAIAVLNEMEAQWAIRTVAGLVVIKTYLSGTWEKKRGNKPNEDTTPTPNQPGDGGAPVVPPGTGT